MVHHLQGRIALCFYLCNLEQAPLFIRCSVSELLDKYTQYYIYDEPFWTKTPAKALADVPPLTVCDNRVQTRLVKNRPLFQRRLFNGVLPSTINISPF